jgi:hypothetical protein
MSLRPVGRVPGLVYAELIMYSDLFLIDPPPGASHTAIPPNEIVLAGDSAGGGLCLSLLTLIRDMSLPMPAGGVLISPWVDLTHSFPSVMDNTATVRTPFEHPNEMVTYLLA